MVTTGLRPLPRRVPVFGTPGPSFSPQSRQEREQSVPRRSTACQCHQREPTRKANAELAHWENAGLGQWRAMLWGWVHRWGRPGWVRHLREV